jgi:hypothetical protein
LIRFVAAATLTLSGLGCADCSFHDKTGADGVELIKIDGNGQSVSAFRPGLYDLVVSGDGNTVQAPCESAIRILRVAGVNHNITVLHGSSVQFILLSGTGTVIHLPADVHPSVQSSGVNNRILNDIDGSERGCRAGANKTMRLDAAIVPAKN